MRNAMLTNPKSQFACIAITLLPLLLLADSGLLPTSASAQTSPSSGRLRVVVRNPAGQGVDGLVVTVLRQGLAAESANPIAQSPTDWRGVADFDTSDQRTWPSGGYALRFHDPSGKRKLASTAAQADNDGETGLRLFRGGDEWVMYSLLADGRLVQDYSYSLSKLPDTNPPPQFTPRPMTWDEVLRQRGITPLPTTPAATATPSRPKPDNPSANGPAAKIGGSGGNGTNSLLAVFVTGAILAGVWLTKEPIRRFASQLWGGRSRNDGRKPKPSRTAPAKRK